MDSRPNFYEFLKLDPEIDDWETLHATLVKMRNRWSTAGTQTNQAVQERARLGLSLLAEMERVFRNPKLRREEARALIIKRAEETQAKGEELDRLIDRMREASKGCSEDQFQRLVARFRSVFDEASIRERLEVAGMVPGSPPTPVEKARHEFLDEQWMRDHDQRVKLCGQPDLYALFGLSPELSIEVLFRAVDERYKEIVGVGTTDAVVTAEKELAGFAQDLFKSLEKKQRYDNSLKARRMVDLREKIEFAGALGTLSEAALEEFVDDALALGVKRDIARSYILAFAARREWEVLIEPPLDPREERMRAATKAAEEAAWAAREMQREMKERDRREDEARRKATATPSAPTSSTSEFASATDSVPLPPPEALLVKPIAKGFRLSWKAVQGFDEPIQYVVVRKRGAIPQTEGDGEMVSPDLAEARFDDTAAPPGERIYYAVFSVKGEQTSTQAAVSEELMARSRPISGRRWVAALVLCLVGVGSWWGLTQRVGDKQPSSTGSGLPGTPVPVAVPPVPVAVPPDPVPVPPDPGPKPVVETEIQVKSSGTGPGTVVLQPPPPPPPLPQSPPPPPPPIQIQSLPEIPALTVIGVGDSGIVDSFTDLLTDDLIQRGFRVVRPGGLLGVKSLLRQGASEVDVLQALQNENVQFLVWAEAQEIGRRELRYLGNRTDTLYNTAIEVNAFLVANHRGVGGGWREQVEHTGRNSHQMAEEAMLAMGYDLSVAIEDSWRAYRATHP